MGRARAYVIGDPQAPLDRVTAQLDRVGILNERGEIADDATLISIGDHFDYRRPDDSDDERDPGAEGVRVLRWLADADPERAIVLMGNHDAARVMELIRMTDAAFVEARELAERVRTVAATETRFHRQFPDLPTPGLALRDYASYCEAQRDLVMALLLSGRMQLAAVGVLETGREVLITHAGVTQREAILLGLAPDAAPAEVADRLNALLAERVGAVREAWTRGERVPLSLAPVHLAGVTGEEGGGLLYHRPADPEPPNPTPEERRELSWKFDGMRPRRFDPRSLLPLAQVCGHTTHRKCAPELRRWCDDDLAHAPNGPLRTLFVSDDEVRYGAFDPETGGTALHMIDGGLATTPPERYELLPLSRVG